MAINISNATADIKIEITVQTGEYDPEVYFIDKSQIDISYDLDGAGILKIKTLLPNLEFRFPFASVTIPAEANIVDLANAIQAFKTTAGPAAPLPAGASTEAKQDAQIVQETAIKVAVESINTKTPASPATEGKQDTGNTSLTTIAGKDFSTETTLALIKAKTDNLDVLLSTRTKPSDTQPISAASLPLPTGAATEATLATRATEATLATRLSESDFDTKIGSLTETAPGTDTASSGLNGRLQRIAQRITTLIGSILSTQGDVAHDAADSGNPIKVGHKAIAHGANPAAVAANDRTDSYANRHGIPFVIGGHPNIQNIRANYTGAQTDTAIISASGGTKIVVTSISVAADNANTVDVAVRIGFGAATTPTTTGVVLAHPGIGAGSGIVEGTGAGIIGIGADGEDLRITSEVPTTGSIDVTVSYYTIES